MTADLSAPVTIREHAALQRPVDPRLEGLPVESQAALRQFTQARLTGYGVDPADAAELHEIVLRGRARWQDAATSLAERCLHAAEMGSTAARVQYLLRASALLRTSQVMMLADTPERAEIYARSARVYAEAADLAGDRAAVLIATPEGPLAAWRLPAHGEPVGVAVVIGGVEGYAMDFDCVGEALAARGIETFMLDAPGQGESRFTHHHYLSEQWLTAMSAVVDHVHTVTGGLPVAVVGDSMGGSLAMTLAAADTRVRACVDNGGIPAPWLVPPTIGTFFTKMVAFCGADDPQAAQAAWSSVTPLATGPNAGYPLLVVHGGADPMVTLEMAQTLAAHAPTDDVRTVVFSDGDHCVYNHRADRDALIGDWTLTQLTTRPDGATR